MGPQPLIDEILSKEKGIIESTEFTDDWGTRLGKNSLTSRSNTYNLLEFDNAADLRDSIRSVHDRFLQNLDMEYPSGIFVQCWANVMRKKERLLLTVMRLDPTHILVDTFVCRWRTLPPTTLILMVVTHGSLRIQTVRSPLFQDGCVTTQIPCHQTRLGSQSLFDILSENGYYEDVKTR